MDKNPGMSFEEVRTEANVLVDRVAGRKVYSVPRVYSLKEQKARQAQFLEFSTLRMAAWDPARSHSGMYRVERFRAG
jgi:hypothetical protein